MDRKNLGSASPRGHKGVGQDGTIENSNAGSVPRGRLCPGPPSFGNENVRRKWRNQKNTGDVKNRHKQQHPQETLPWSCKKEDARSGPRLPLYQQDCRASCCLASQRDLVNPGPAGQHLGFDFQFDFHTHKYFLKEISIFFLMLFFGETILILKM